jgi:hypothetical protein
VLSFKKRPEPEPVFNIEVDGDHVYRVGEQGLLVHNASAADTARLTPLFQPMLDPAQTTLSLTGLTQQQIIAQYLPQYDANASNPTYGILIAGGNVYGFQSGINAGTSVFGSVTFRRGTLSTVNLNCTTVDFVTLEAHIEAMVAAFMLKHNITSATLYINATNPCLGATGCNASLPHMLPFGSTLRVLGTGSQGTYNGV